MDIKIICPDCHEDLQDIFSSVCCRISIGGRYWLDLECLRCEKDYRVNIIISKEVEYGET